MARNSRFECKREVLSTMGFPLPQGATVLDFGCGAGDLVQQMRDAGYQAFGCDLEFKSGKHVEGLSRQGYIRLVPTDDYRLPFADDTFDLVSTDQVFEHVQDHEQVLTEIFRVLKPGGTSLNVYPPRWIPIEPHVFVPLASWFRPLWWLQIWAFLGVRKSDQVGKGYQQVAQENSAYLLHKTNYVKDRETLALARAHGADVYSGENSMLEHYSPATHNMMKFNGVLPIFPWLCRTFISRVIMFRKAKSP